MNECFQRKTAKGGYYEGRIMRNGFFFPKEKNRN